jgi:hypothetical protein
MATLNIQIFVDVIGLLSGAPITKAVHMFDDGGIGGEGQGTSALMTSVLPGQLVRWTVNALDVQTQVWIKDIGFGPIPEDASPAEVAADAASVAATEELGAETQLDEVPMTAEKPELVLPAPPAPHPVWGKRFEGHIPFEILPDLPHLYHLKLAFASGNGQIITVNGPALRFVLPQDAPITDGAVPQFL